MARLPTPGQDSGTWGAVLNEFLTQAHTSQGILKSDSVGSAQIQANAVTSVQLADNSVDAAIIADGSITEAQLDSGVQTKLNAAAVGGVSTVNSRSGAVTLTKSDVDLANVDNTSDASKPVSSAMLTALNAKAATSHTHAVSDVANLQTTLDGKAATSHTHAVSDTTGLQTALDGKAATSHTHTASQISDSTTTGRSVLTAADAAAARTAVGLGNVNNTSDASKPISTAVQTALDGKLNTTDFGAKVILINTTSDLPPGTPAGVIVVTKA